jgi:hypothetical protein
LTLKIGELVAQILLDSLPQSMPGRGVEDLQHGSSNDGCAIKMLTS